jgi:ribosomal protein L11 methyltransferase
MSSHGSSGHLRCRYRLPAEREDGFVAELAERGTLGAEVRDGGGNLIEIDAWFPSESLREVAEPGREWRAAGVELIAVETLADQDWLAAWRAAARPFEAGRRFLLDPREPEEPPPATGERILLRLPARAAFGTGSHESTRLALELLEAAPPAGRTVLDVGTGTGVLAFAALALGAGSAAACDVDPVAAIHAGENRRLNRVVLCGAATTVRSRAGADVEPGAGGRRPAIWAGGLAALCPDARFDLVLANVLPERILPELSRLAAAVAPGGALIYSGLLAERGDEIAAVFAGCGLAPRDRATAGDWIALRLEPVGDRAADPEAERRPGPRDGALCDGGAG